MPRPDRPAPAPAEPAPRPPGLWRRTWAGARPELAVLAVGSLLVPLLWGVRTRPMGDTPGYRVAARVLADGWPVLTERTPGYPLLLLLTGASQRSGTLLLVVQLLVHLAAVVLVVDLARACGVGRRGTVALAVLLVAPPVLLRVVHEGTEALAALLVTLVAWLLVEPVARPRATDAADRLAGRWRGVAVGACCAAAALVRPTFALLVVPVAVLAARWWVPAGPDRARSHRLGVAATVAVAGALPVLALVAFNGIRFDAPGLTPLAPYHLSSRVATFVEELPASEEPARSVLVRARDRALRQGDAVSPENFIWTARDELSAATGLRGRALDRYVWELDLRLIASHPFDYVDSVVTASTNYVVVDSQPAVLEAGRATTWTLAALHWLLLGATVAVGALVPGLWLAGRVDRRSAVVLVAAVVPAAYTMAVSVAVESGTARLRAPTEPLLALALVLGASCVLAVVRQRSSTGSSGAPH